MTLVNLAFAGHLAAIGLVGGVWALVNATANTKYVCADTSDTYVMSARWLDAGQFATAFATSCLVLYRQVKGKEVRPSPQFAVLVELSGALGILVYVTLMITTASVCGNNKCITSAAASEFDVNPTTYNVQVANMAGATNGSNGPCQGALIPSWFNTPQNYCPTAIAPECGTADSGSIITAERCSVYACSNLVPGAIARYTISMICLVVQIMGAAVLAVRVRRELPTEVGDAAMARASAPLLPASAPPYPYPVEPPPLVVKKADDLPGLRKRTRAGQFYTSVPDDLNF